MLKTNDYFEYAGSVYLVDSISPSSASVVPIRLNGKDRLGNPGSLSTNISLNSHVRILTKEEAEKVMAKRDSDGRTKKRGRPKGSKNKSKPSDQELIDARNKTQKKRGRPKGSKNKPK